MAAFDWDTLDKEDSPKEGLHSHVDTQQVLVDLDSMKRVLRDDSEVFIEVFLAEHLTFPVPDFHKTVFDRLKDQNLSRILLAIPRDHAKTTLSKLCVLWYFLHTNHRFAVYLSSTSTVSIAACRDIMGYMDSDNFKTLYGPIVLEKSNESLGLWIFKLGQKRCILRAMGANQQIRGMNMDNQRPDIAVIDDLEDIENTADEKLQKKLDSWVFRSFLKALGRNPKIIWLGNMISSTCLLYRLSQRENWNPIVLGSLVYTEEGELAPLWPERWPLELLADDLAEYQDMDQTEGWFAEMMNMPGAGVNGFSADNMHYDDIPERDEIIGAFLTVDPAFGQKTANDDAAVAVHVIRRNACPMVVDCRYGKFDERGLYDLCKNLATEWNAWVWGIENVAAQGTLGTLFKLFGIQDRLENTLVIEPLHASNTQKVERIGGFVGLMAKKGYAIPRGDIGITAQLLQYDRTKKKNVDDLIDACAYGPQMLTLYMHLILAQWQGQDPETLGRPGVAKYGMEIADV